MTTETVRDPMKAGCEGFGIRRRVVSAEKPAKGWAAVNTYLRQVFAKPDVNSRVDLTRLATERGSELAG